MKAMIPWSILTEERACTGCGSYGKNYHTTSHSYDVVLCPDCWHTRIGLSLEIELVKGTGCTLNHARMILALAESLGWMVHRLNVASKRVRELEQKPRCCGREFTNGAGSLYMHHSRSDICPLHGAADREAERGLRSYIGKDPDKQTAARQSATNYAAWQSALAEMTEARNRMDRLQMSLSRLVETQQPLP